MADKNTPGEFELCEPPPCIWGENGRFAVTDGKSVKVVFVTEEAMKATAWPPEASLDRLLRYADYYRRMAAAAISRGEAWQGKVWICEKDVLASPAPYRFRGARFGEPNVIRSGKSEGVRGFEPKLNRPPAVSR